MSKPESQTQNPKTFFEAPVYEKHELEEILRVLNVRVKRLAELLERAVKAVDEIYHVLYYKTNVDIKIVDEISEISIRLKSRVYDAIDELIVSELRLDTDIEKYEREYKVEFPYVSERQLGVALLKENETVKPVVVWTDYSTVDYYEGERSE